MNYIPVRGNIRISDGCAANLVKRDTTTAAAAAATTHGETGNRLGFSYLRKYEEMNIMNE